MPEPNFASQTIWTGDNLPILRGLNSETVDLIYLDPPFNSKTDYAAPIGSRAAGAAFKDTWTLQDVDVAWLDLIEAKHPALWRVVQAAMTPSDKSYLVYMAARLLEMRRILKPTGSIFLHCDPTMSHYLKLVMDAIYVRGGGAFRNEIIWSYRRWPSKHSDFQRMHDVILRYSRGPDVVWHQLFEPASESFTRRFKGKANRLEPGATTKRAAEHDTPGLPMRDVWDISILAGASKERVGYPTQKPRALLERIIKASSNPGEVVLDPFAGCATACVAAELLERQWVGIDISPKAADLVRDRMQREVGMFYRGATRSDVPRRTDIGRVPAYGSRENREALYGQQGGLCNGCREHFRPQHLEVDHIIARAHGGTDHIENLQLLCGHCNRVKGDRGQEYLIAKLAA
ncbi:MAG: hypothetical protein F4X03_01855 [Dehalococcoidia bacterium]|nr:hypothetical protein [Dehalococcoidia bacterium]MYD27654.1 hypothetical protein [Dehalococcoidia bacterium]